MHSLLRVALAGVLGLGLSSLAHAQAPGAGSQPGPYSAPGIDVILLKAEPSLGEKLAPLQHQLDGLGKPEEVKQAAAKEDDKVQKQLDLQKKQIDTLEKMVRLLADQLKKKPATGADVEKLQTQVATMEARAVQAAQRDVEVAHTVDAVREHIDAEERYGPRLPAPLKELFFPSGTNETPLTIHGVLTTGYTKFQGLPGEFEIKEFAPFFLLKLNDRFLLEAELGFSQGGVELSQAQVDFLVNDWLTVVAGHFLVPIGFFNERIHPSWINKLPDFPLMFHQVSPADFKTNGLQARGAQYLGCTPVKLEYSAFVGNGLAINQQQLNLSEVANLQGLDTSMELRHNLLFGGRLGFWLPERGLMAGISGMCNGPYSPAQGDSIDLWQVDVGYHKGSWDVRLEYAQMFQEAVSYIGNNINRRGLYAQIAYRPTRAPHWILENLEVVFRYGYTNFSGIDPTGLDLTTFNTQVDIPVNRHQYTVGLNYYFTPSLVVKCAYEINREPGFALKDDVFMAQLAWGF